MRPSLINRCNFLHCVHRNISKEGQDSVLFMWVVIDGTRKLVTYYFWWTGAAHKGCFTSSFSTRNWFRRTCWSVDKYKYTKPCLKESDMRIYTELLSDKKKKTEMILDIVIEIHTTNTLALLLTICWKYTYINKLNIQREGNQNKI